MIKKLLVFLSLLILLGMLGACSSNPAKVEANNAEFAQEVEAEAEESGNLAQTFTVGS